MTAKQAHDFIAKWRPILCSEWEIEVKEGHDPDVPVSKHHATIDPSDEYLRATMYLGDVVGNELSDRDQRRVLLHELLHLTTNDLEKVAKEPANALGYEMNRLVKEQIDWQSERLVDRLACVLADLS